MSPSPEGLTGDCPVPRVMNQLVWDEKQEFVFLRKFPVAAPAHVEITLGEPLLDHVT